MSQSQKDENDPDLVTIHTLSIRLGMTEGQIRGRIQDGHWVEGTHFYRKGKGRGSLMMDYKACKEYWTNSVKRRRK